MNDSAIFRFKPFIFQKMNVRLKIGDFKFVKKWDVGLLLLSSVILYWHYGYGESFKYAVYQADFVRYKM